MDVYLDSDPLLTDAATLGAIIDLGRAKAESDGRLIVEVRLDGRALSGEELDDMTDASPGESEVQMVTADPRALAVVTLGEVKDALAAARDQQKQASDLLSADEPDKAHEPLRASLEAWGAAEQAVGQVAALLEIDLDRIEVGGRGSQQIIEELVERLNTVRRQMTAGDWIGLADTLAYELDETAVRWVGLIDALVAKIEEG